MKTLKHLTQIFGITLCAFAFTACEKEEPPIVEFNAELNMAYDDIQFYVPANAFMARWKLNSSSTHRSWRTYC